MRRFDDIIEDVVGIGPAGVLVKVSVVMVDGSFLDVYWSDTGRYSLHYERRHLDGSFPKHYHHGSEGNVTESYLPDEPMEAVKAFLEEIRALISSSRLR